MKAWMLTGPGEVRMRLKRNDEVTVSELRDIFDVDIEIGKLYWKKITKTSSVKIGDEAGSDRGDGYRKVGIHGKSYLVHRILWAIHYGEFPDKSIDHINRDPSDNRISNLRLATRSQNNMNSKVRDDNTSGVSGVTWCKERQKWLSRIIVDGKSKNLGRTPDKAEAIRVRKEAERMHYGEFAPV